MSENIVSQDGIVLPKENQKTNIWHFAGVLTTPVRWTLGWLFFSAFLRRMINEPGKMNPDSAGYIGQKFNHFMPHAIAGQKEVIEYLLAHPTMLQLFLVVFTILEGLCGLGLITGTLTRLSALGIALMSYGILTGAGWIGTTCLDEWQIGVLGITGALVVMAAGAPRWSIDSWLNKRFNRKFLPYFTSGNLPLHKNLVRSYLALCILSIFIMLSTYQIFFNGLWGKLHNHSVKPEIELSNATINTESGLLNFTVYRTGGPDTYGAFLVKGAIMNSQGNVIKEITTDELSKISKENIDNKYLVKIAPTANALHVPLGGSADIKMNINLPDTSAPLILRLEDISGIQWSSPLTIQ